MSTELLPCPFCGDEHFGKLAMTYMHADGPTSGQRIKCNTCGAQAPDTVWNRRAQQPSAQETIPPALREVVRKIQRFAEICEDCDADGVDFSREWFDALVTIGLLERVQRSPALWEMTSAGESLIRQSQAQAAPTAQPRADTSAATAMPWK